MATKKEIEEQTKTCKLAANIFVHTFETIDNTLSVRTYRFGKRPPDYVETREGFCIQIAKNKKEFINVVYQYLK